MLNNFIIKVTFLAFLANCVGITQAFGAEEFVLPRPGQMVPLSSSFSPVVLKGLKLDPNDPFRFHFFVSQNGSSKSDLKTDANRLIKYFLASLTTPDNDLWVNLSPYEKDRIIPLEFGQTAMGRDLLAQDYLLKQITASLMYPEGEWGKKFWKEIYSKAQSQFQTTNIPVNTFNKVWIVPEKAIVYENNGTAFVLENHLKVMLEEDYLAESKHTGIQSQTLQDKARVSPYFSDIVRQIVIPVLTKEVNEGKNFAQLRQVFNSLVLATWYKKKIKDSLINKVLTNQNKIQGINIDANNKNLIYNSYLAAFKKGVYNYIKDDVDPVSGTHIPRKYFSGGVEAGRIDMALTVLGRTEISNEALNNLRNTQLIDADTNLHLKIIDKAMATDSEIENDPIMTNSFMKNVLDRYSLQSAIIQFLKRDHPLKIKIFNKVDNLTDKEIIDEVNRILALPLLDPNPDKGLHLYTPMTVRELFLFPTQGEEDIPQALTSILILSYGESIESGLNFYGPFVNLILEHNYLLLKALEVMSRDKSMELFQAQDLKKESTLMRYLTGKAATPRSMNKFLSFGDFLIERLLGKNPSSYKKKDLSKSIIEALRKKENEPIRNSIKNYLGVLANLRDKTFWPTDLQGGALQWSILQNETSSIQLLRNAFKKIDQAMMFQDYWDYLDSLGSKDAQPFMMDYYRSMVKDINARQKLPIQRGNGWIRLSATPTDVEQFKDLKFNAPSKIAEVQLDGQVYRFSQMALDKARQWFRLNPDFERIGVFLNNDFEPLTSVAYDPASEEIARTDPKAVQMVETMSSIIPMLALKEMGFNVNSFKHEEDITQNEDVHVIEAHSHPAKSGYPNRPSKIDMSHDMPQIIYSQTTDGFMLVKGENYVQIPELNQDQSMTAKQGAKQIWYLINNGALKTQSRAKKILEAIQKIYPDVQFSPITIDDFPLYERINEIIDAYMEDVLDFSDLVTIYRQAGLRGTLYKVTYKNDKKVNLLFVETGGTLTEDRAVDEVREAIEQGYSGEMFSNAVFDKWQVLGLTPGIQDLSPQRLNELKMEHPESVVIKADDPDWKVKLEELNEDLFAHYRIRLVIFNKISLKEGYLLVAFPKNDGAMNSQVESVSGRKSTSDLMKLGVALKHKYELRHILKNGPIAIPPRIFAVKRDPNFMGRMGKGVVDTSYMESFADQRDVREYHEIISDIIEGRIQEPMVYKPNFSNSGKGIFFIEHDEQGNLIITLDKTSPHAILVKQRLSVFKKVSIQEDPLQDLLKITVPLNVDHDDKYQIFESLHEIMENNEKIYDSGLVETKMKALVYKGQVYQTRHFGSITGTTQQVSLGKDLWRSYLGSSEYFANHDGRNNRALMLSRMEFFKPLYDLYPYLRNDSQKFEGYVDTLIDKEFHYLFERLMADGFDLSKSDIRGNFDLLWMAPKSKNGFPEPFLVEAHLLLTKAMDVAMKASHPDSFPQLRENPKQSILVLNHGDKRPFMLGTYPILENGQVVKMGYIHAQEEITKDGTYQLYLNYSDQLAEPDWNALDRLKQGLIEMKRRDNVWILESFYPYSISGQPRAFQSTRSAGIIQKYISEAVKMAGDGLESYEITSKPALISYLKNGWPQMVKTKDAQTWSKLNYDQLFDFNQVGIVTIRISNTQVISTKLFFDQTINQYRIAEKQGGQVRVDPKTFNVFANDGQKIGQIVAFEKELQLSMPPQEIKPLHNWQVMERLHGALLEKEGYKILTFDLKIRRNGLDFFQADALAQKDDNYYFVEVKHFNGKKTTDQLSSVIRNKQKQNKFERYQEFFNSIKEEGESSPFAGELKKQLGEVLAGKLFAYLRSSSKLNIIFSNSLEFDPKRDKKAVYNFMQRFAFDPGMHMDGFRTRIHPIVIVRRFLNSNEPSDQKIVVSQDVKEQSFNLDDKKELQKQVGVLLKGSHFVQAQVKFVDNQGTVREIKENVIAVYAYNGNVILRLHNKNEIPLNALKELKVYYLPKDEAMINGGIDLNPSQMNLETQHGPSDFHFNFNGQMIDAGMVVGADFEIKQMTPVANLSVLLT